MIKKEIEFDEGLQSAPDYAIVIDNPPDIPDSRDPDKWKEFLHDISGGHVTFVTLAVDNGKFLKSLIECRRALRHLRQHFGVKKLEGDALQQKVFGEPRPGFFDKYVLGKRDPKAIYEVYMERRAEVVRLSKRIGKVTNVFAIFETEKAQREALKNLSVGSLSVCLNRTSSLGEGMNFCGTVLDVSEPDEPDSIRWLDLAVKQWKRRVGILVALVWTCIFIFLGAFAIISQREKGGTFVAMSIAVLNAVTPTVCSFIVSYEIRKFNPLV